MWISFVSSKSDRNIRLGQRRTCGSGLGLDVGNRLGEMKSGVWSRLCWCGGWGFWSKPGAWRYILLAGECGYVMGVGCELGLGWGDSGGSLGVG